MKAHFSNPSTHTKKIHAECWREKKISCKHKPPPPPKKNSLGIKGLKKKFMPIPNHPTPLSEVKWLAP